MEFVKCPKCKRPILDRARSCPGCGTPIGTGRAGTARRSTQVGTLPAILFGGLVALAFVAYTSGWRPRFGTVAAPEAPASATPAAGDNTKFGLSEQTRREVYQEILRAEDHAQVEADRRYPPPDANASSERWQRRAETREQFRKQAEQDDKQAIAKHYGLTVEQLQEISSEGFQSVWPRPVLRSLR